MNSTKVNFRKCLSFPLSALGLPPHDGIRVRAVNVRRLGAFRGGDDAWPRQGSVDPVGFPGYYSGCLRWSVKCQCVCVQFLRVFVGKLFPALWVAYRVF